VDSFAGLFDGFYYIFNGESTSKADKYDNLRSLKILNMPLTQKSPEIQTKRPEQEQNLRTKKGAISWPWRKSISACGYHTWCGKRKKKTKNKLWLN